MTSRTESTCCYFRGMYFGAYPIITNYSAFTKDTTNNNLCGCIVDNNDIQCLSNALLENMQDSIWNINVLRAKSMLEKCLDIKN